MKLNYETFPEWVLAGNYGGANLETAMQGLRLSMDDLHEVDHAILYKSDRRLQLIQKHAPGWMINRYSNEIVRIRRAQALLEDMLYA